jgi:nucleotide-binding universal stress UspA family protein
MLAHVIQEPQIVTRTVPSDEERGLIARLRELNVERARIYLAEIRERIAQDVHSVDIRALVASSPAAALLDLVAERKTDLVVIAAHGRNFNNTYRFDSTTSWMLANLRCPTMVIIGSEDRRRADRWSGSYVSTGDSDQTPPTGFESV